MEIYCELLSKNYRYDGLGSVADLTDPAGNSIQSYQYNAYGNLLTPQAPSPHGFSTKEYSAKSGLIYFGARYYDPRTGRWMSKDIITWAPDDPRIRNKGDFLSNLNNTLVMRIGMVHSRIPSNYIYAHNNPVMFIDIWGLTEKAIEEAIDLIEKAGFPREAELARERLDKIKVVPWIGVAGWTNPITLTVYIEKATTEEKYALASTIAHEMKHVEDFAYGRANTLKPWTLGYTHKYTTPAFDTEFHNALGRTDL